MSSSGRPGQENSEPESESTAETYRFMLYNIRYGTGFGWKFHTPFPFYGYLKNTDRHLQTIVDFIRAWDPDIVGLVEVDGGSVRASGISQADRIAMDLGHGCVFENKYTNPFLSRHLPILNQQGNAVLAKREILGQRYHYFERGVKRLILEIELEHLVVFVVHLSIKKKSRLQQLTQLSRMINGASKPVVVGGDFNVFYGQKELDPFLEETRLQSANHRKLMTYPSRAPRMELDYIFHSHQITVQDLDVPNVRLSDHLPLVCDMRVPSRA